MNDESSSTGRECAGTDRPWPPTDAERFIDSGADAVGSVVDADLTPLLDLPPSVTVVVDDAPHHSQTEREIQRLRGAA